LKNPSLPLLVLVRHGETAWTLTGQHTGRSDIALTAAGAESAKHLRETLGRFDFAEVLTSPLKRARQTAELAGYGDVAHLEPDLCEWDYGDYHGRTTAAIRAERPDWRLFEHGCPNGESPAIISERADRVIARIQRIHAAAGNVIVFAHSDILRVFIARWLLLPGVEGRRVKLDTSSISILSYDHDLTEPVIRRLNQMM
jgi:broad specificity phosphatase PhoE